jgi:hypothetical protein
MGLGSCLMQKKSLRNKLSALKDGAEYVFVKVTTVRWAITSWAVTRIPTCRSSLIKRPVVLLAMFANYMTQLHALLL